MDDAETLGDGNGSIAVTPNLEELRPRTAPTYTVCTYDALHT